MRSLVSICFLLMICTTAGAAPAPKHSQNKQSQPVKSAGAESWVNVLYRQAAERLLDMSPDSLVVAPAVPGLLQAVQEAAIKRQILDRNELKYICCRPAEFGADLKLLRKRNVDFADAPPVEDAMRFPDRTLVNELITFNRHYREHLVKAQSIDLVNGDWYQAAISETDALYRVWDTVRDVGTGFYNVTVRRSALKKLREMVGPYAYYSGCLGPHVPIWRFRRID